MLSQDRQKKLKRKLSPVERVIEDSDRPRRSSKRTPVEELIEDSYDEVMGASETEDFDYAVRRPPIRRPSSFDSLEVPFSKKAKKPRKFIIRAVVVDKFTIPRKRVLLTPSMCQTNGCPFDIAEKNGYEGWGHVPRSERPALLEALEEHKQMAHNKSEDYIVDEDQLPTRWLGSERGLKGI